MAIYYLYLWMKNEKTDHLLLAGTGMQLATLASLSLLPVNLLFTAWVLFRLLVKPLQKRLPVVALLLLSVPAIAWFINYSFELRSRGLLYYGIDEGDGFWQVTVRTLVEMTFDTWGEEILLLMPLFLIVLVISVILLLRKMILLKEFALPEALFVFLFVGCLIGNLLMHHLLGINYPADRVALHYMVLLPCALVFSIDPVLKMVGEWMPARITAYGTTALLLVFPINLLNSMNTTHSVLWERDASARTFMKHYLKEAGPNPLSLPL